MKSWPADKVERRLTAELVPYAKNARTHSPEQVDQIVRSIREFGFTVPILIDEDGGVIAGHGRLMAAKKLGLAEVPVMMASGWTDEQRRAYVIADNKLAEHAGWDRNVLIGELTDLQALKFDIGLTGLLPVEIAGLLDARPEGKTDPDTAVNPLDGPATAQRGDVWTLGRHRIMCGDSTSAGDVAALLAGEKPHLMVTDPPYGVKYDPKWRAEAGVNKNGAKMGGVQNDDRADWREAWALFPGDVAYVWHAGLFASTVQSSLEASGFAVRSQIMWAKDRFALSRGDYHWQHEPCWYAVKHGRNGHYSGGRSQSTLWQIPSRDDAGHGHGTQKPVECMKRPIENNSVAGDAVYEPFSGSGTTIIACEMTGRRALAMEVAPAYVDVAVRRWQDFTGEVATLDGVSFADVTVARSERAPAA